MKEKYIRFKNFFNVQCKRILSQYKFCLVIMFFIFLVGIITGIMTCSRYSSEVTCDNLINKYLLDFLTCDTDFLSYFLILSIWFIILSIFTILFVRNKFMCVIINILIFFMAYIYGFDLCIIIINLGLAGIILGIFIYLLFGLFLFFVYILMVSILCKKIWSKTGCDNLSKNDNIKINLLLIVLGIVAIFFLSFFFSLIHIFVIVEWFIRFFLKNVVD